MSKRLTQLTQPTEPLPKKSDYTPQFWSFMTDENQPVLTLEQLQSFSNDDSGSGDYHDEQEIIRQYCLRDTWFFAQRIMREHNSLPLQECHKQFCNAMVQPSPDLPLEDWDASCKERALLCFRNFGKSTINRAHIIQTILADPNIRILLVSGVVGHAARELHEIVRMLNYTPVLAHLFPEFTNASVKTHQGIVTFKTAARTQPQKEATITCSSFRSQTASGHYEYISCDDAQNESTTGSDKMLDKGMESFDSLAFLLQPHGYIDYVGCRQHERDVPAQMMERSIVNGTILGGCQIPVLQLKEGVEVAERYTRGKIDLTKDVESFAWEARWNSSTLRLPLSKPRWKADWMLDIEVEIQEPAPEPLTIEILNQCITTEQINTMTIPVMSADLSEIKPSTRPDADPSAIIAGWFDPESRVLTVSGIINQRLETKEELLAQLLTLHKSLRYLNLVKFRCENNRNEQVWAPFFDKLQMTCEFQKDNRINRKKLDFDALAEGIRQGKVKFTADLTQSPEFQDLILQCCNAGDSQLDHDDISDALGMMYRFAQTLSHAESYTYPFDDDCNDWNRNDDGIIKHPVQVVSYPSTSFKIRKPDVTRVEPAEPYTDPYYSRTLSTGYER